MFSVQPITDEILRTRDHFLLFIQTPFCGTCQLARTFLNQIENTLNRDFFYDMNGSLYPDFLQKNKIRSVPCLLMYVNGHIEKEIYVFHSTANILSEITDFDLQLFEI